MLNLKTPTDLLNERAASLSAQTEGVVTGEVRDESEFRDGDVTATFYLVGEQINYRYLLFRLSYPANFYPARLSFKPLSSEPIEVAGESELAALLEQVFAAEKTREVVDAIIERSRD